MTINNSVWLAHFIIHIYFMMPWQITIYGAHRKSSSVMLPTEVRNDMTPVENLRSRMTLFIIIGPEGITT